MEIRHRDLIPVRVIINKSTVSPHIKKLRVSEIVRRTIAKYKGLHFGTGCDGSVPYNQWTFPHGQEKP